MPKVTTNKDVEKWDKYVKNPMFVPNPEYDRAGFCVLCHQQIALFDTVDLATGGKAMTVVKWLGVAREEFFVLNDGSQMKVMMCVDCQEKMTPKDIPTIMLSVYKGWKFEIEETGRWPEFKKKDYLEKYGLKFITKRPSKSWNKGTIQKSLGKKKLRSPLQELKAKKDKQWLP